MTDDTNTDPDVADSIARSQLSKAFETHHTTTEHSELARLIRTATSIRAALIDDHQPEESDIREARHQLHQLNRRLNDLTALYDISEPYDTTTTAPETGQLKTRIPDMSAVNDPNGATYTCCLEYETTANETHRLELTVGPESKTLDKETPTTDGTERIDLADATIQLHATATDPEDGESDE